MPIYPIKNEEGPGVQSSVWSHVDQGDPHVIWRIAVCVLGETMDRRNLGSGAGVEFVLLLEAASGQDSSPDWTAHRLQLGGSPRASQSSHPRVLEDGGATSNRFLLGFWPVPGPGPHRGSIWGKTTPPVDGQAGEGATMQEGSSNSAWLPICSWH